MTGSCTEKYALQNENEQNECDENFKSRLTENCEKIDNLIMIEIIKSIRQPNCRESVIALTGLN